MIELEHDGIGFTAIDTWVGTQEIQQVPRASLALSSISERSIRDVPGTILRVVLLLVRGPARSAITVSLSTSDAAPSELVGVLGRPTTATRPNHS